MNKLLIRYHSFLVLLLCTFSASAALGMSGDFSISGSSTHEYTVEYSSFDFFQFSEKKNQDNREVPTSIVKPEKNDEEEIDGHVVLFDSNPAAISRQYVCQHDITVKELQKIIWQTTPFVWPFHADRGVFYQVFRI